VYGGLAHGIKVDTAFTLYDTSAQQNQIGSAVVSQCWATHASITLSYEPSLSSPPSSFYCKLNHPKNDLTVYCPETPSLSDCWLDDVLKGTSFSRTRNAQQATVIISPLEDPDSQELLMSFAPIGSGLFTDHIGSQYHRRLLQRDIEQIRKVLEAMGRFRGHLARKPAGQGTSKDFDIQFHLLEANLSHLFEANLLKIDERTAYRTRRSQITLRPSPESALSDLEADIKVNKNTDCDETVYSLLLLASTQEEYGMSIENRSEVPLFAYILIFNPGDLTIGVLSIYPQLNTFSVLTALLRCLVCLQFLSEPSFLQAFP
jgi:hypothetical protein